MQAISEQTKLATTNKKHPQKIEENTPGNLPSATTKTIAQKAQKAQKYQICFISSIGDSIDEEGFFFPKKISNSNNSSLMVQNSPIAKPSQCSKAPVHANFNFGLIPTIKQKITVPSQSTVTSGRQVPKSETFRPKHKKIKVDEVDLLKVALGVKKKEDHLNTIKEVSDSFSSQSNKDSFNTGIKNQSLKNDDISSVEFSFMKENNDQEEIKKSRFADQMRNLVESFANSCFSDEEEKDLDEDDDEDSDSDVSMYEGILERNPEEPRSNESSILNNTIELEILMNGLNNNGQRLANIVQPAIEIKSIKSFNCCFSLFTSKNLESNTEKSNIENRLDVEFLRFAHPCKKLIRANSLPTENKKIQEEKIYSLNFIIEKNEEIEEIKETVDYEEETVDLKKMVKKDDICLLCDKRLRAGVHVTCYELCDHYFHEDCVMETIMEKWTENGCCNNLYFACPQCVGVEKWRMIFEDM